MNNWTNWTNKNTLINFLKADEETTKPIYLNLKQSVEICWTIKSQRGDNDYINNLHRFCLKHSEAKCWNNHSFLQALFIARNCFSAYASWATRFSLNPIAEKNTELNSCKIHLFLLLTDWQWLCNFIDKDQGLWLCYYYLLDRQVTSIIIISDVVESG